MLSKYLIKSISCLVVESKELIKNDTFMWDQRYISSNVEDTRNG